MGLVEVAEKIIASQMQLVDCEGELVACVNKDSDFKVLEHWYEGIFFGWNVYVRDGFNLVLIETYNTELEARNVVEGIREGLAVGDVWYQVPGN